jgi:hypothetical protein
LEGEGVVGEGAFEAVAEDGALEEGAAFDGETGFASGEIVAMDGLVVFENIEEAGLKKKKYLFARRIFLSRLATFWGIAPSNIPERCRFFCGF